MPYASGIPSVLVSVLGGAANTGTVVGFGNSFAGIGLLGGNITLAPGSVLDFAFVAPRAGTITSLAGFFSATAAITLGTASTIQLQIFTAPPASNVFSPAGVPLVLSPALNVINIGTVASGIQVENISVGAGDKVLLFVSTNAAIVATVAGFVSAGITFD
ncbi:exosporium protein [Bacillus cereus]|uniref:Exosporium protein n=1 Tax=Bacillus cereus TaxID=1396 RepID=A0A2B1JZA0_BACCE|nr:exosporium protein [Bacillus cereus]